MNESMNELTENIKRDECAAMNEEQASWVKKAEKMYKNQNQSEWYKKTVAMVPLAMKRWDKVNPKTLRFHSGKLEGNAWPDMKIRNRDGAWEHVYYCFCECGVTLEVFESDLISEKVTECEVCADPESFADFEKDCCGLPDNFCINVNDGISGISNENFEARYKYW